MFHISFSIKFVWFLRKIILKYFRLPEDNPLLRLNTWHYSDRRVAVAETTADDCYKQSAGLSSEQREREASPDTIMFKPVATRSLSASAPSFKSHNLYHGSPCYLGNRIGRFVKTTRLKKAHDISWFLLYPMRSS